MESKVSADSDIAPDEIMTILNWIPQYGQVILACMHVYLCMYLWIQVE